MNDLRTLATQKAIEAGLDPALICAIVEQESAWNPWAIRFEPAFYEKYVKPMNLSDTEEYARSFSWGLMQTMGEVVRELGYKGPMAQLCDPEVSLEWGCKVFKKKLDRANGDVRRALLFWNGGGRPAYADEVLARVKNYA